MSPRQMARVAAVACALVLISLPATALAVEGPSKPPKAGSQKLVPGEVIVRFTAGSSRAERTTARRAEGAVFERNLLLANAQLVRVADGSERAAAAALERRADVVYAEPNAILRAQATPNDVRFSQLWGLNNTGQTVGGVVGTVDADIDAVEGWSIGTGLGSSTRVAVIDTGVARSHPDLSANMFTNPGESGSGKETNGVDDDANGKVDDWRGWDFVNNDNNPADGHRHGTHVAGTIAARSSNSIGVAGTAAFPFPRGSWGGPKIIAIKVLSDAGSGSTAGIADGFVYAGVMGARVANVSLGGSGTSPTLDNAIKASPNTLFAVAAGNDGTNNDTTPHNPCTPASLPDAANKICVAATDPADALASFSNFGATHVDLAAPGVRTMSTLPTRVRFSENFETDIAGRWTTNDLGQSGSLRWTRTTLFSSSASNSLTDSAGGTTAAPTQYEQAQDNWARNTTGISLTGGSDCVGTAWARINTNAFYDYFQIEATTTPATPSSWVELLRDRGGPKQGTVVFDLSAYDNANAVFIRFRLNADGNASVGDGAYVDDIEVRCFMSTFDATSYGFLSGTSMATPHVAGVAAFVFTAFPTATVAQVKSKILASVDKKASLTGKVLTGGRLNLYKAAAKSSASVSSGSLTFTAGSGQTNNVTVTRFTDRDGLAKYRISDPYASTTAAAKGSRISPGPGCARVTDTAVKCGVAGVSRIRVYANDLNDTVSASTIAIPVTLDGGSGSDLLTAGLGPDSLIGGTGADTFTAGAGSDTISARHEDIDTSFSCGESTSDSDLVNADLDPSDPVTQSATNCEVVSKL